ncbi:MAG: CBS domain-containing protein, partial [Paraglaciecola sp.]|nr:CBS domain-containing protein [Paraglaciecola sp.]
LNQDVLTIAEQMLKEKPKTYPVVDDSGVVVGVLTRRHILKMLDSKLGEMA